VNSDYSWSFHKFNFKIEYFLQAIHSLPATLRVATIENACFQLHLRMKQPLDLNEQAQRSADRQINKISALHINFSCCSDPTTGKKIWITQLLPFFVKKIK
jgi:hypothetical protein